MYKYIRCSCWIYDAQGLHIHTVITFALNLMLCVCVCVHNYMYSVHVRLCVRESKLYLPLPPSSLPPCFTPLAWPWWWWWWIVWSSFLRPWLVYHSPLSKDLFLWSVQLWRPATTNARRIPCELFPSLSIGHQIQHSICNFSGNFLPF